VIIAIYVDDLLIISNSSAAVAKVKLDLQSRFEMTDLGDTKWILGIEVTRDRRRRTLKLSQRRYILDILERHGMSDSRPMSTPMVEHLMSPRLTTPEIDARTYQSAVGSLMYAMLGTHADLAHAVGVLSQFSANPGDEHWTALKRVFRYLRGTTNLTLVFDGARKSAELTGFVDSDWAGDRNDRRSITSYVFLICGGAISWSSKKQSSTAQSSTEAEYMAGAHAAKEVAWLRAFLSEIGRSQNSPTSLFIDNQSAIALAKNPKFHNRTKHIAVRYHFIREKIEDKEILPQYIPTSEQVADILTKGLPKAKFSYFVNGIGLQRNDEDAS
jgi:Reverse transcriptase (RNA-dependent DNA polymerase)